VYKGLTPAGLGQVGGLEQFVRLASRNRFQAVDTDGTSLEMLISARGKEGALAFLNEHQVKIGAIGLSVEWRNTEEQFRSGLDRLVQDAKAAAELGVTACCTYVLPSTDWNPARFMAVATRRLRTCAEILGAYNIRLGLEFVGPHHLRTKWKHPFIWDMADTLEWIDAIHAPNVGLLLDCYHWHTTGATVEDLLKLDKSQIVHVHINDAPAVPVEEALDNERLYPGEGVIDLVGFLKALRQIGYNGVVSQEVLLPQPPTESPETLAAKSAALFDRLYAAAGISPQ